MEYRKGMAAAGNADYATAERYVARAAARVPSSKRYADRAHYIRGIRFVAKQQEAAAITELEAVKDVYGHQPMFRHAYCVARLNRAWDSDDYVEYLARAEELFALEPSDPQSVLCIAAGNAYRYAQTGREDFRRTSERYLTQLETMQRDVQFEERIARVRRCLATRVIPPH